MGDPVATSSPRAGETVAELIRRHDWAATPLGAPAQWSQSLRTVVDVLLASPAAMAVVWGDTHVQLYNDAFAALLAERHPAALGASAGDDDATWPISVSLCDRIRAGAPGMAQDEAPANDAPGELPSSPRTLSYAPIHSEDGGIAGVLVTATDPAAEHERQQRAHRLRLAMDASSAGAWTWDARSNEATWDDGYHAMYGFAPDEPRTHEAWLGRLHADDRPAVVARLNTVVATPGDDDWNMEFRAVVPGRGVVWMQGLGRAIRDADGTLVAMTGINLDIGNRKGVEQKLRESEEQLRLFFDYAPAAAAMLDTDMRYVAVSRRWLQDFGLPDDIIGRSHYEVFPEIPERWKDIHRRCLAGAVERSEEDRFERADGSLQWLRWEILPWRRDGGSIGGIIVLCEDISEQRRWRDSQQVLISELQHRTRNLITVVESIAQQTMRTATSLDSFMTRFGVRLRALARVQNLLSRSDREPITIGSLVRMELEALGPEALSPRTFVAGPEVRLRKRAVQTLALAIHELATNACKYGALAADHGQLSVIWHIDETDMPNRYLILEWTESGIAPPVGPADQQPGYGRTLIERALPYSLSAETTFELRDRTFRCSIRLRVGTEHPDDVVG